MILVVYKSCKMGNFHSKYELVPISQERIITRNLVQLLHFYIRNKTHFVSYQEKQLYKYSCRLLPMYSIRKSFLNNRIQCLLIFYKDVLSHNFSLKKYYNQKELHKKATILVNDLHIFLLTEL